MSVTDITCRVVSDRCSTPSATGTPNYDGLFSVTGTASIGRAIAMIGGSGIHADPTNLAHYGAVIGISITAGTASAFWVQDGDEIINDDWNFTDDGPVYIGADGVLTQTPPDPTSGSGFIQQVAVRMASNRIKVLIHTPMAFDNS